MLKARIREMDDWRLFRSPMYNYDFNKENGFFARWGTTKEHDPEFSPFGPEIADIEISTGDCSVGCKHCYKSNTNVSGHHMSLETFKAIFDKMPPTLTQIALGLTDLDANKDLIPIMEYCRANGVVPNFTLAGPGLTDELAEKCASLAGAIAVSVYPHTVDMAYNTVAKLTHLGMEQVNIHLLYHQDNQAFVYRVLKDTKIDSRLKNLNAVILLGLKPKGRARSGFVPMCQEAFAQLVDWCFKHDIRIGFDSCTAPRFERWAKANDREDLLIMSESCESSIFSIYISADGKAWPCSFSENELGVESVDVLKADDFLTDVWYSQPFNDFRASLLASACDGCRKCIVFEEINK